MRCHCDGSLAIRIAISLHALPLECSLYGARGRTSSRAPWAWRGSLAKDRQLLSIFALELVQSDKFVERELPPIAEYAKYMYSLKAMVHGARRLLQARAPVRAAALRELFSPQLKR
eukprot:6173818-Pleurochrysis_carterae.AAC.2